MNTKHLVWLLAAALCVPAWAGAEEDKASKEPEDKSGIGWQMGPAKAKIGNMAEIDVPEGFRFADAAGTKRFLELTENIPSGDELAMLAPKDLDWFIIFTFDDVGYVKDDEKDKLDADAMLTSLKEGYEAGNEARRDQGFPTLTLLGWVEKPHYENVTHNLEWSLRNKDDKSGSEAVNHNTRYLGRRGVMQVELVAGSDNYQQVLPAFRTAMGGFEFTKGQDYSSFVAGDKIAEYGLSALVLGGAAAAAAKTGLLKTLGKMLVAFWKVIVAGLVALGGAIKKLFSGRKQPDVAPESDPS